jgi:hypothetical protein
LGLAVNVVDARLLPATVMFKLQLEDLVRNLTFLSFATACFVTASIFAASSGYAADAIKTAEGDPKMAEMMKKMKEAGTPGAAHKVLADMAGTWTYKSKHWMAPDAKPEEGTGTSTLKMMMGGRWLQHDTKTKMMGMDYEGSGLTGYNNITKKYETTWIDNMSTSLMKGEGSFDTASKTLKESGTYSCPITNGERTYRTEWKILDKNNMVYSMYGTGMDPKGPEYKTMELTFKRK